MRHASVSVIGEHLSPPGARVDDQIIGRSAAMREIIGLVRKIAGTDVPVVIQGETGTGKQTIAREIHRRSRRAAKPLVCVVCASLRESDLESDLFGEPRGDVRGDAGGPASLLESSRSSTLFLDGVGQLPLWAQVKLLDAWQGNDGRKRDDGTSVPAQPRLIVSTTCDLETMVAENRFYSGLYYCLNAVRIDVPPLRHRQEDIVALAEYFLAAAVSKLGPPRNQFRWRFSAEARQALLQYDWPGNVLQLAAVVGHAAILAEGPEIGQAAIARLMGGVRQRPDSETISVPLTGSLKDIELTLISEVVRRCRGNKAAAARALGLHRRTLYRLLEK